MANQTYFRCHFLDSSRYNDEFRFGEYRTTREKATCLYINQMWEFDTTLVVDVIERFRWRTDVSRVSIWRHIFERHGNVRNVVLVPLIDMAKRMSRVSCILRLLPVHCVVVVLILVNQTTAVYRYVDRRIQSFDCHIINSRDPVVKRKGGQYSRLHYMR